MVIADWASPDKTVILIHYYDGWTWEDYVDVTDELIEMLDSVSPMIVHTITAFNQLQEADDTLVRMAKDIANHPIYCHHNTGLAMVSGAHELLWSFHHNAGKLGEYFGYSETVREAREFIAEYARFYQ